MKRAISRQAGQPIRKRPVTLVETLAYVAVFSVVVGMAIQFFFGALDSSEALRRAGEDILRVQRFGDQWRSDLRRGIVAEPAAASREPAARFAVELPRDGGRYQYRLRDSKLVRIGPEGTTRSLSRVAACRFLRIEDDPSAWRCDIELAPRHYPADTKPRFSFIAVEGLQNP